MPAGINPYSLIRHEFIGHWCATCSGPPELFTFRGGYVSICSACTAAQIAACPDRLPYDLIPLEWAAHGAVRAREKKELASPSVDLDTFYRCDQCRRLIPREYARYPARGAERGLGIPPHCPACYELVQSGVLTLRQERRRRGPPPPVKPPHPDATRLVDGRCERCGEMSEAFAWATASSSPAPAARSSCSSRRPRLSRMRTASLFARCAKNASGDWRPATGRPRRPAERYAARAANRTSR